ncbi:hypothetical protein, partial [Pseudarthrobacter oxydans]|uniref:hypothetical protein n=1 Tax=Pseudarthrobacter oxydans TaxID=1671 RepID=UPI003807BBAA
PNATVMHISDTTINTKPQARGTKARRAKDNATSGWPLLCFDDRALHLGIVGLQAENRAADDCTSHREL